MPDSLATLEPLVAADLRDPARNTFATTDLDELINAALVEISRIAPYPFQEDVTLITNQLEYAIQQAILGSGGSVYTEVSRVEVWDKTKTPYAYAGRLNPMVGEYVNDSSTGWEHWAGLLRLTNSQLAKLNPTVHILRVKGYAPFPKLVSTGTVNLTTEQHYALRAYARLEGLRLLVNSRELFAQWQTASHNTDVSLAALMNLMSLAEQVWTRRANSLRVLREVP